MTLSLVLRTKVKYLILLYSIVWYQVPIHWLLSFHLIFSQWYLYLPVKGHIIVYKTNRSSYTHPCLLLLLAGFTSTHYWQYLDYLVIVLGLQVLVWLRQTSSRSSGSFTGPSDSYDTKISFLAASIIPLFLLIPSTKSIFFPSL